MNLSYGLYMGEQEGLLDTRQGRINRLIKAVKNYDDDVVEDEVFEAMCENCGIDPDSLTSSELRHISNAIKS